MDGSSDGCVFVCVCVRDVRAGRGEACADRAVRARRQGHVAILQPAAAEGRAAQDGVEELVRHGHHAGVKLPACPPRSAIHSFMFLYLYLSTYLYLYLPIHLSISTYLRMYMCMCGPNARLPARSLARSLACRCCNDNPPRCNTSRVSTTYCNHSRPRGCRHREDLLACRKDVDAHTVRLSPVARVLVRHCVSVQEAQ